LLLGVRLTLSQQAMVSKAIRFTGPFSGIHQAATSFQDYYFQRVQESGRGSRHDAISFPQLSISGISIFVVRIEHFTWRSTTSSV